MYSTRLLISFRLPIDPTLSIISAGGTLHAIVIGAGVIGASIAYYLSAAGARVTVIERGRPGGGTSGTSTAYVNAVLKRPEHYHRFSRLGVEAYDQLEEELGPNSGIGSRGALHWPGSMPGGLRAFDRTLAELEEWDYPHEVLSLQQASKIEPNVRVKDHSGPVLYLPNERWVEGETLARTLCDRAVDMGARLMDSCSVIEIVTSGGRATGVDTSLGFVAGDQIVVAAGVSSVGILAPLGYRLPLGRSVGVLAKFRSPTPLLNGVVYPGKYHCRPTEGGGVMIGSDDFDVMADEYTDTSKATLLALRPPRHRRPGHLRPRLPPNRRVPHRPAALALRRPPANRPSSRRGGRLCRGHAQRHNTSSDSRPYGCGGGGAG